MPETAEFDAGIVLRGDPRAWFETKATIRLASGRISKPGAARANVLQRRIFALAKARRAAGRPCFAIGLKPRKRGFSTAVAALNYHELAGHGYESVIVGNKLETSETVFRMVALYADRDDFARTGRWSSANRTTTERITWQHGSMISQSTAKSGESIRGQTPQIIHGTEVAHWEQEDEVFLALMNAVPDDPNVSVWLESTPKGRGGEFYNRWQQARWPKPDECPDDDADYWRAWEVKCPDQPDAMFAEWEFVRVFAAWFEFDEATIKLDEGQKKHIQETLDSKSWYYGEKALIEVYGQIDPATGKQRLGNQAAGTDVWEQLAWRRMTIQSKCGMDPSQFDQEYPRDPHSCFLASGRPVFDADAIEHYSTQLMTPDYGTLDTNLPDTGIVPHEWFQERTTWRTTERDDAIFLRWESPRVNCQYLIVIDTAEGEDQAGGRDPDRHSVLVLRRGFFDTEGVWHKTRMVARVRPPCQVPIHVLVEWAHRLHLYYSALVIPEMNSSGLAYITGAKIRGTPIWKRTEWNPRDGKEVTRFGWRTTDNQDYSGVRTLIIDHLGGVLRKRELDLHCGNAVHELGTFVNNSGRKEAEKGEHDDDVLALAIGLYKIDAATGHFELPIERIMPADLRDSLGKTAGATKGPAHDW
jgi:hypothetical protein